jgi:phage anti-repressor protein
LSSRHQQGHQKLLYVANDNANARGAFMTNDSIPVLVKNVKFNGEDLPTVDARDLHKFLEVKRDFSNWIKSRIEDYGFVQSQDYVLTYAKIGERQNVKVYNYMLTLDMAKELCMIERNDKGRQARRYFIACEKRVLAQYRVDAAQIPLKITHQSKAPKPAKADPSHDVNAESIQELLRLVRLAEIIPQLDPLIALLTRLRQSLPAHVAGDTYPDHLTRLIRDLHTGKPK